MGNNDTESAAQEQQNNTTDKENSQTPQENESHSSESSQTNGEANSSDNAQEATSQEEKAAQEEKGESKQDKQDSKSARESAQSDDSQEELDDDVDDVDNQLPAKFRAKLSKKNREAANLRSRLNEETARADRAEVAMAAGLPAEALKFLTGATREELEKNAEDLLVMLGTNGRVTPNSLPRETAMADGQSKGTVPGSVEELDSIGSRMYSH